MKVLLDTNIIIHREAEKPYYQDIGILFRWLDKLKIEKCIHPITVEELSKHIDRDVVRTMAIKVANYVVLKTQAPMNEVITSLSLQLDKNENDINDTKLLNEVYTGRVDYLISEDRKLHRKATFLKIADRVFKIDTYLEKVTSENPELVDYKVLAVKKQYFGEVDLSDGFFDSFRRDYPGFDKWFNKKANEISYVCYQEDTLSAFLYLKTESDYEYYGDIQPAFERKTRLKIGTFKVTANGYKIGERFLKIIFDNALITKVKEIYVTIFDDTLEQKKLITLLEEWGFVFWGYKKSTGKDEKVFVRDFSRDREINLANPKLTYPYVSRQNDLYFLPVRQEYHTELFPDSILRTESPKDFVENEPHRNALSKVYISHSSQRIFTSGDRIFFYRTGGLYKGVITTLGVIESVVSDIKDIDTFIALCRKRSVFSDNQLRAQWERYKNNKPFIVNFLYVASLPKRPNLSWLIENGVISSINDVPRTFHKISEDCFDKIVAYAYRK